jgi:ATP-dependent Lon protease
MNSDDKKKPSKKNSYKKTKKSNENVFIDDTKSKITIVVEDDFRTPVSGGKKPIPDLKNNIKNNADTDDEFNIDNDDLNIFKQSSINNPFNSMFNNLIKDLLKSGMNKEIQITPIIEINNMTDHDKCIDDDNKENKENKENNISKVDYSSLIGDINYLDKWLKENLDKNNKFNGDEESYSSNTIDNAASIGKVNILNFWLDANKKYNLPIKYSINALRDASKNGHIMVLKWFLESGLKLEYDNNAIDEASNNFKIQVLDWWIDNKDKLEFKYSSKALDNCKLEESKLLKLIKWWKNQKDKNNIEFKYTKIFLSYIENWRYLTVHNYLVENKLIKEEEYIKWNNKSSFINFIDFATKSKDSISSKIDMSSLPPEIQKHIKEKEEELSNNMLINGKAKEYIDNLLKIPFGKYKYENIFRFMEDLLNKINLINSKSKTKYINSFKIDNESDLSEFFNKLRYYQFEKYEKYIKLYNKFIDIRIEYLNYVDNILNSIIYGHDDTKLQIKCMLSQWLSGGIKKGIVIGIQGPPGVGKTTFIKGALSKCMVDYIDYSLESETFIKIKEDEDHIKDTRPFSFISLGGTTNSSTLIGHNITYHGATYGDIVSKLKEAKIMNPILYFDELDKISNTEHGNEISSVLTHITDPAQNEHFTDRYFSEVKIDLSKCIIVFSYNDSSRVDKILLDRIHEIVVDPIKLIEKIEICKKFIIPEICKSIGYNHNNIKINDNDLKEIIIEYTHEAGVRKLKEKLEELVRKVNYDRIYKKQHNHNIQLKSNFINDSFSNYSKVNYKKITNEPKVGHINGLFATTNGIGGITIIQVKKVYSKDLLSINTTGSLKDVMKESIDVAKTVAWNLLNSEEQDRIVENYQARGLHLHCPDGATPKDGPSGGTAITCVIYSFLTGKPIKNDIAITGEVDLDGNVTMIGGLDAKLTGAKHAGVKLALIPKENERDLEIIKKKNNNLIDDDFQVITISHVNDAIRYIFA